MFSASVAKAAGVSVQDTNISVTTAWRKGREVRARTADKLKDDFVPPDKVLVH